MTARTCGCYCVDCRDNAHCGDASCTGVTYIELPNDPANTAAVPVAIGTGAVKVDHHLIMTAVNRIQCENCPTILVPGDECQIAGPGDIRLVCMPCFATLNG